MATVITYNDEDELQAGVGGTVTTYDDEAQLNAYLATITTETVYLVTKGIKYTTITDPTATFLAGVVRPIVAKGIKYTVILA